MARNDGERKTPALAAKASRSAQRTSGVVERLQASHALRPHESKDRQPHHKLERERRSSVTFSGAPSE